MQYLKQFTRIAAVCLLAEVLYALLPLPIPASIYGLVLMLGGLLSGVIKLEQVEHAADFLVQIMPVFFIPAAVGLMDKFDTLRSVLVPFLVTLVVSLVFTMGTTGLVTQFFLRRERKGEKK